MPAQCLHILKTSPMAAAKRCARTRTDTFLRSRARYSTSSNVAENDAEVNTSCVTREQISEANENYRERIEIRPCLAGWGLFALDDFQRKQMLMKSRAVSKSTTRRSHSIQTNWKTHIQMDMPAILINHACGPPTANVYVQPNDWGAYDFLALRSIGKGEALLFDYETVESDLTETGFTCFCGSPHCRGELKGCLNHENLIRQQYGSDFKKYIASYLLRLEESSN